MGMKTPLIKIRGNLMRVESIITFAGISVGGEDNRTPMAEKQKVARRIPTIKGKGWGIVTWRMNPIKRDITDTATPKRMEAIISPRRIPVREMGAAISLSKVFILVSQGAITGPTEVAEKKRVIPSRPGMRRLTGIFLPIEKARKKKKGKRMPKITTGPL